MTLFAAAIAAFAFAGPLSAQWLNYPTPGIPRKADGKPDLKAPAPRTPEGKPDFSGLWQRSADKYYNNAAADLKPGEIQPWAEAVYLQRRTEFGKNSMETQCLPVGPAYATSPYRDAKIIQTPSLIVILSDDLTYRQVFMDGRALEKDPNPSWMGYSVGHWDGDTLVVESTGFNDKTWLDFDGHPHTEQLRMTERYRRRDFGHIDVAVTFDDPKVAPHPWTVNVQMELEPDTEMLEFICENERDKTHMTSQRAPAGEVVVPASTLAKYAGVYEIKTKDSVEVVEISVSGGALFWELDNQGSQRLIPISPTAFSLSGTRIEFVPGPGDEAAQLVIHEVEGETKGTRRK